MVELGATVVEVNVRGLEPLRVAHAVIITSEMLIGFKAMFGGEKEAEAAIKHTGCAAPLDDQPGPSRHWLQAGEHLA